MISENLALQGHDGPILLCTSKFVDSRGRLEKFYWKEINESLGFGGIREVFHTVSEIGTIRAFHFQDNPKPVKKIITILRGSIREVIIDIRKSSPNFGKPLIINVNSNDAQNTLFIPVGFAHGYQVLESGTVVQYLFNEDFDKDLDEGFNYNSFENTWLPMPKIVSDRDKNLKYFNEFESKFK
jgi:dTDP-4-dehydrorhamnose 3,5-epimerase